jgi:hypothetical protein
VATEAAWLDGKKEKNHERSSLLLTGTGLLMEGLDVCLDVKVLVNYASVTMDANSALRIVSVVDGSVSRIA